MTNEELAWRTRDVLEREGWRSYRDKRTFHGVCLFIAADRAHLGGSTQLAEALGFKSLGAGMTWNDEQKSVEAIYERLERVA